MIDAHNHFLSTGESLGSLDLRYPGVDSAGSLLQAIRDAAEHTSASDPITGFGFDNAKYELPTLAELDAAAGNHPLHLFHTSGHNVLVNTLVLAEAGVDEAAADPPGGRFVRMGTGGCPGCVSMPRAASCCRPPWTSVRTDRTSTREHRWRPWSRRWTEPVAPISRQV